MFHKSLVSCVVYGSIQSLSVFGLLRYRAEKERESQSIVLCYWRNHLVLLLLASVDAAALEQKSWAFLVCVCGCQRWRSSFMSLQLLREELPRCEVAGKTGLNGRATRALISARCVA